MMDGIVIPPDETLRCSVCQAETTVGTVYSVILRRPSGGGSHLLVCQDCYRHIDMAIAEAVSDKYVEPAP